MIIEAIPPTLLGSKIHLHLAGYQPSEKTRTPPDRNMCGQFTHRTQWEMRIPLAEALRLGWGHPSFKPDTPDYVHTWKTWVWCRACVGHGTAAQGILHQVVAMLVAEREEKCQRPERCAGCTGKTCTKGERFARDHGLHREDG